MKSHAPQSVDEYIASAPKDWQPMLKKLRQTIKTTAPRAQELISYQIAGYKQDGPLVYFSIQKKHCSLHAISLAAMKAYGKEIESFKGTPRTLHFTVEHQLPVGLVKKIVKMRLKENRARVKSKAD